MTRADGSLDAVTFESRAQRSARAGTRFVRGATITLLATAAVLLAVAGLFDVAFAATRLSADGDVRPYTALWITRYRVAALVAGALCGALAVGALARGPAFARWAERHMRALRRTAVAVAGATLALLALELAARALESRRAHVREAHDFEAASRAFLKSVASQRNADGFRDDAFDRPRAPGERRVLVVGDSFAFGFGIDDASDGFCAALERELAAEGLADVFNAGVPGADTRRECATLATALPRVQPDLVLLQWYVNDAESDADKQAYVQQSRLVPLFSDVLLRRSALWRRVEPALVAALVRCGQKTSYVEHLRRLHDAPRGDAWTQREAFDAFVATARASGARVGVVLFPMLEDEAWSRLADVHALVARRCADLGVPCLDLADTFRGEPASSLHATPLDHHLNAQGCARAARATAAFVRERGLWR